MTEVDELKTLMQQQLQLSRRLRARVRELEDEQHGPIAVVGMGMRFPGGITDAEAYWDFLLGDGDAVTEIPEDRAALRAVHTPGPLAPGRSYVGRAAFLDDVADFDPGFFGISTREGIETDPQQRLLLEVTWEALERAGIAVRRSEPLDAGVFVGIMASEYLDRIAGGTDKTPISPYYGTGSGHCFAAGRVSYALGFSGPALSVDTACSSSLVALHLAVQSLRRRECRYAVVGGANMLFSSDLMVSLAQSEALAPDGRSKPFAADADGYGRGEGVAAFVLMRLEDARREGRPVLAVVRGTAVNHDGRSSGLTVPNGPAQERVLRAALKDAGVEPAEVGYVEAHGTGTALGDPIEVGALDAVYGAGAPQRPRPLAIGSVKGRIGHLEAASGLAGLAKVVLMLRHQLVPAGMSAADTELNPHIRWDSVGVEVPRQARDWSDDGVEPRLCGLSAFGLSGTNAHVIVEAAAEQDVRPARSTRPELLTLSAKTPEALRERIRAVRELLAVLPADRLASVCHTLRAGRGSFAERVSVVGSTAEELSAGLAAAVPGTGGVPDVVVALGDGPGQQEHIEAALTRLAVAFPGLAPVLDRAAGQPAPWRLKAVLSTLGIMVRPAPTRRSEAVVRLGWAGGGADLVTDNPAQAPQLLLHALAGLFTAGADLRLASLASPGTSFDPDVPTYPFQRTRLWIDEHPVAVGGTAPHQVADSLAADSMADTENMDEIVEVLMAEVARALGTDAVDPNESFIDAGGDSFTVMLFVKGVRERFGVELSPEDFASQDAITEQVDSVARLVAGAGGQQR